jgi:hypothetical protein
MSLLSFTVACAQPEANLELEILLDQHTVYRATINTTTPVECVLPQDNCQHTLYIAMSGKTPNDTKIDQHGAITQDAVLTFTDFKIAGVDVEQIVYNTATYQHNHNGGTDTVQQQFYGVMGCNGTVTVPFYTPVYNWIVENL